MNYVNPLYNNDSIKVAMERIEQIMSNYKQSISVLLETPAYQEMKNIQAQINNMMKPFAQDIQSCIPDCSIMLDSLSKSLKSIADVCGKLPKLYNDDNTEDELDTISEEMQTIIFELPIDDTAKEGIVSSEEYQSLKKKEPWTRSDKIGLAALLLGILTLIHTIFTSLEGSSSETTVNNFSININNSETEEKIKQFENSQEYIRTTLESILEQIEDEDDTANSSQNSLDSSSLKKPPEASPSQYPKAVDSQPE